VCSSDLKAVLATIDQHVDQPLLGFIGQPRVNVLALNRALDARFPKGG
jgi:K+-transporting ATPase ATPase C chain